jgi:hypothetical protein
MLKYYAQKFAMDIVPSVVATIIGAYIVNHYITTKSGTDAPAAAAVSTANPKGPSRNDAKPADVASIPGPGIKAKGISERAMMEKSAAERPAAVVPDKPAEAKASETKGAETKAADTKPETKPSETASAPAENRRTPVAREKEKVVAKVTPTPAQAPVTAAAPAVNAAPAETAAAPEEHRDANDLARAAIERLRNMTGNISDGSQRTQEAAHTPEAPHAQDTPRVAAAPATVRPLPPPITVSAPPAESYGADANASYTASIRNDGDPSRPVPPADIPASQPSSPLDIRADAAELPPQRPHTNVAEDMLSAAKSVFHAVLPK